MSTRVLLNENKLLRAANQRLREALEKTPPENVIVQLPEGPVTALQLFERYESLRAALAQATKERNEAHTQGLKDALGCIANLSYNAFAYEVGEAIQALIDAPGTEGKSGE